MGRRSGKGLVRECRVEMNSRRRTLAFCTRKTDEQQGSELWHRVREYKATTVVKKLKDDGAWWGEVQEESFD